MFTAYIQQKTLTCHTSKQRGWLALNLPDIVRPVVLQEHKHQLFDSNVSQQALLLTLQLSRVLKFIS